MRWWCGGTSWGKREDAAATAGAGGHVGASGVAAGRLATRSKQSEKKQQLEMRCDHAVMQTLMIVTVAVRNVGDAGKTCTQPDSQLVEWISHLQKQNYSSPSLLC